MFFLLSCWLLFFQVGEMAVLPSNDPDKFRLIYKGDMKWNVVVKLLDRNESVRYKREVKNTDSFLMPLDLSEESSGIYTVKISTPAYDLTKQFDYIRYEDKVSEAIDIQYLPDRNSVNVEYKKDLKRDLTLYVYSEFGDKLIEDNISASESGFYRVYYLKGATAREIEVIAVMSDKQIKKSRFNF